MRAGRVRSERAVAQSLGRGASEFRYRDLLPSRAAQFPQRFREATQFVDEHFGDRIWRAIPQCDDLDGAGFCGKDDWQYLHPQSLGTEMQRRAR